MPSEQDTTLDLLANLVVNNMEDFSMDELMTQSSALPGPPTITMSAANFIIGLKERYMVSLFLIVRSGYRASAIFGFIFARLV